MAGPSRMLVREPDGEYGHPARPRLLDRVREALRVRHYSRRTEEASVAWIRRFILFHGKRHPAEMGREELDRCRTLFGVLPRPLAVTTTVPMPITGTTITAQSALRCPRCGGRLHRLEVLAPQPHDSS